MSRARNWILTCWKQPVIELPETKGITFYVSKKEICPETKKEHWHIYIEYDSTKSMKQVKEHLNDDSVHCEPRMGTQKQAIDYVIKEESKAGNPVYYGTPKKQGKRSDIDEIFLDIQAGASLRQILINHQGNALRMMHAIEKGAQIMHDLNMTDWIIRKHQRENWTHPEDDENNEVKLNLIDKFQKANGLLEDYLANN